MERDYAAEGVQDLICISLPSRAYVPVIERRAFDHKPVAGSSPAKPTRLLVLPLTNLAGGREREFFSDGLTEELIQRLSCSPGLQVLARTTAMALRGKSHDIARLRDKFAVDVVIEGSVRQTQNQVNVSLRLISPPASTSTQARVPFDQAMRARQSVGGTPGAKSSGVSLSP